MAETLKHQNYYIRGMHCASCELIIEEKLLELPGVEFADASLGRGELAFDYRAERPSVKDLNAIFRKAGYLFSEQPFSSKKDGVATDKKTTMTSVLVPALAIIAIFILAEQFGLASLVNVTSSASWLVFFVFGLIAGVSSCAALVGGLLLSLSKQWNEHGNQSSWKPSLLFNFGRITSYILLGLALGLIGQKLQLSPAFNSILLVGVSILMTILALQMLGVRFFQRFRIALPKNLTRKVASGSDKQNRTLPFVFGFLTFLLPCGFTLMVEGLAILSGSPLRGALMLGTFALGTAIPLMAIGFSSAKLLRDEARADRFVRIAGILVLFFVLYNLNVQFRFVDRNTLDNLVPTSTTPSTGTAKVFPLPTGPTQVIKTTFTLANDIQPSTFTVKKGQPVSFQVEVKDNGQGCMSTIMIRGLYNQPIYLQAGKTITMDFTPIETGDYQIACAMGVPRGTLKVID